MAVHKPLGGTFRVCRPHVGSHLASLKAAPCPSHLPPFLLPDPDWPRTHRSPASAPSPMELGVPVGSVWRERSLWADGIPRQPQPLCLQLRQEVLIMASKTEKRVASSVFITLAPPRRDVAVTEEVGQEVCEAPHARPWETLAPMKTPGTGLSRNPNTWTPSGRTTASLPAAPPQLSNGGKSGLKGNRTETEPRQGGKNRLQVTLSFRCLLCTRPTMEPTCLHLSPGSSELCDVAGHLTSLCLNVKNFKV